MATFATWNPSDKQADIVLGGGNLSVSVGAGAGAWCGVRSTIGVSSGKWYWEYTVGGTAASGWIVGAALSTATLSTPGYPGGDANGWGYQSNGNKQAGATAFGASYTAADVIGVALDMNAGTVQMYKNNVLQGTLATGLTGTFYAMVGLVRSEAGTYVANFGATSMTYTAPTGYNQGLYTASTTNSGFFNFM